MERDDEKNEKNRKKRVLTKEQEKLVNELKERNRDIFAKNQYDVGKTEILKCTVNLKNENMEPVRSRANRFDNEEKELLRKEIRQYLDTDVIEESNSSWAASCHFVPKANGKKRLVFNFTKLNEHVKKDNYPLPRIDEFLSRFEGAKWFTALDLKSGFHNVVVEEKDREKLAFVCEEGLFQWKRMPFGFKNAPEIFQRMMDKALGNLRYTKALGYIDDIIIYSETFEQHLIDVQEVFDKIREAGLKLGEEKCHFCIDEVEYLGYIVCQEGIKTNQKKNEKIRNFPIPKDIKEVRAFLGLVGYYRKFIKKMAHIAKPLYEMLKKDKEYLWGKEQQSAFKKLKERLDKAPILAYPDFEKPFIVTTDASKVAIAATLSQVKEDGYEHPLEYFHKSLTEAERKWHSNEWEYLAIVEAVKNWRHYLRGQKFTIRTDSKTAKGWFRNYEEESGRDGGRKNRWKIYLQGFDYEIIHIKGKENTVADILSRTNFDE